MALSPVSALANPASLPLKGERALRFDNLHTGEKLKTVYWQGGKYIPDALTEINKILRDHRNDEVKAIDKRLLDLLAGLSRRLETDEPFEIISGYRSPATNAALRAKSSGVAKNSYHMRAMAIDIRVPGIPLAGLRREAMRLSRGGVGYYPKSGFVHVDVGPVRSW